MKTNFKISIPKPCHEDWNKFTPDEKGAFCKVCSKSVYDFTKKSAEEVSAILIEEIRAGNKVCGRFNEEQLTSDTPTFKGEMKDILQLDAYSLNFKHIKKFALALFLVFGGYLFNSLKSSAQKMGKVAYTCRLPLKGEVQYAPPSQKDSIVVEKDTINILPVNNQPKNIKYPELLGDVAVEPIEQLQVMGGVAAIKMKDPVVGQAEIIQSVIGDTVVIEDLAGTDELIMGLIAMPYIEAEQSLIDSVPLVALKMEEDGEFAVVESTFVETDETVKEKEITPDADAINMVCYPNPSTGLVNIKYNVKENVQTSIVLYDLNGNLVKTLVAPQSMYAADYSTQFDISDLPDGVYFCTMQSGGKTATQRVILSR